MPNLEAADETEHGTRALEESMPDPGLTRIERYLARRGAHRHRPLLAGAQGEITDPDSFTSIEQVVVIPALAEHGHVEQTLLDLARCARADLPQTLVICVVNNRALPHAAVHELEDNRQTLLMLRSLAAGSYPGPAGPRPGLDLAWIDASSPGHELDPGQGVGTARKLGLDHGLAVLARNNRPQGLLISLDADCRVEPSYLGAIHTHQEKLASPAGVLTWEHPLPAAPGEREAIVAYETFLRGHELGLALAGSPYAFPSIGSTILCRGDAYAAAGGMNQRQAGEDFYFLQELCKTARVDHVLGTTVRPSPRCSSRVPFGTGAAMTRRLGGGEPQQLYHPDSYRILGTWLLMLRSSLDQDGPGLVELARSIDRELGAFLEHQGFDRAWEQLRRTAPDRPHLEDQLRRWLDGFRTLKLLHHLRQAGRADLPVAESAAQLLELAGYPDADPGRPEDLLAALRGLTRDHRGLVLPHPCR